MTILYVGFFGLCGVFARYYVTLLVARHIAPSLPLATFSINILGAFLIGVMYALGVERDLLPPDLRVGLMVGLLGGFTTFSSYCIEAVDLIERGQLGLALFYLAGSPVIGLGAGYGAVLLTRKCIGM